MERPVLVVSTKVKAYIKENGLSTASEVFEDLSELVYQALDNAIENAKIAKRKTVKSRDL